MESKRLAKDAGAAAEVEVEGKAATAAAVVANIMAESAAKMAHLTAESAVQNVRANALGSALAQRINVARDPTAAAATWLASVRLSPVAAAILAKIDLRQGGEGSGGSHSLCSDSRRSTSPSATRNAAAAWLNSKSSPMPSFSLPPLIFSPVLSSRTKLERSESDPLSSLFQLPRVVTTTLPFFEAAASVGPEASAGGRGVAESGFFAISTPLGRAMSEARFASRMRSLTREALGGEALGASLGNRSISDRSRASSDAGSLAGSQSGITEGARVDMRNSSFIFSATGGTTALTQPSQVATDSFQAAYAQLALPLVRKASEGELSEW